MEGREEGFFFANLVDFDMKYGHRNDAGGFASALLEVDGYISKFRHSMRDSDVLMFTADHGCDPCFRRHRPHPGVRAACSSGAKT